MIETVGKTILRCCEVLESTTLADTTKQRWMQCEKKANTLHAHSTVGELVLAQAWASQLWRKR